MSDDVFAPAPNDLATLLSADPPLSARAPAELRRLRGECQQVEAGVSYLRRLVQGHTDILGAESERRSAGGGDADLDGLVARLTAVLSEAPSQGQGSSRGQRAQVLGEEPTFALPLDLVNRFESLVASAVDLGGMSESGLGDRTDELVNFERELSSARAALHERIDAVQAELVQRYQSGAADVSSLLEGS